MKLKCISVKEPVFDVINQCRVFGKESYSDIIERVCRYYMANCKDKVECIPEFMRVKIPKVSSEYKPQLLDEYDNNEEPKEKFKEYPSKEVDFVTDTNSY